MGDIGSAGSADGRNRSTRRPPPGAKETSQDTATGLLMADGEDSDLDLDRALEMAWADFELMSQIADHVDDELRHDVGGRAFFGDSPDVQPWDIAGATVDDDSLPPELLTIMQLNLEDSASTSPELTARICHDDRDLVLEFITIAERDAIAWRSSAEEARGRGDEDEAGVCDHESRAWELTAELLRDALRVVVERD